VALATSRSFGGLLSPQGYRGCRNVLRFSRRPCGRETAEDQMTITPAQVKAARLFLGWTQSELAGQAGVSGTTIGYAENDDPRRPAARLAAVRQALEAAGIEFDEGNGEGPGAIMKPKQWRCNERPSRVVIIYLGCSHSRGCFGRRVSLSSLEHSRRPLLDTAVQGYAGLYQERPRQTDCQHAGRDSRV